MIVVGGVGEHADFFEEIVQPLPTREDGLAGFGAVGRARGAGAFVILHTYPAGRSGPLGRLPIIRRVDLMPNPLCGSPGVSRGEIDERARP